MAETPRMVSSANCSDSVLLTFLIADVCGYTRFTAECGDEAAARVYRAVRIVVFGMLLPGSALGGVLIQTISAIPAMLVFAAIAILLAILTTLNRHVRTADSLPELRSA